MNPPGRTTAAAATALVLATTGGLLAAGPAAAAVSCTSPVLKRQFFANTTFSGTPKKTDCDSAVSENWGTGAPATGLPKDRFGVRWTVTRDFGSGGPFTLSASGLDGIRVYVDGSRRIDLWKDVSAKVSKTLNLTLTPGRHTLRVDYVNWTGRADVTFAYTPRTSAGVDKVRPLAPTGTSVAYDRTTGKAKLSWAGGKELDLAGYRVYRKPKGGTAWSRRTTTTALAFTETLPKDGTAYLYEVRAHDKAGNESAGSADQPVTTVDTTAPAAPAHAENWSMGPVTEAKLDWDANTEPDLAGYRVYRATTPAVPRTPENLVSGSTLLTSSWWTDHPPQTGDFHYYVVTAVDTHGNESAPSGVSEFETYDEVAPTYVPDDLKAVDGVRGVTLTWSWAPADAGVSEFVVVRDGRPIARAFDSYVDTDVERSSTHTYYVFAIDRGGNRAPASASVTVDHVGDYTPPAAVTGLTATPQANGVLLDWDDSTAEDLDHYEIHRGVRTDGPDASWTYTNITDSLAFGDVHSANRDVSLPDGEHVRYVVVAVDKDGNALDTGSAGGVEVTELDLMPTETYPSTSASGSLTVVAEDVAQGPHLRVVHSESLDPLGAATGYHVYRWDGSAGAYERLTDAPLALDATYEDATAPTATTVFYKVTAVHRDGTESEPAGAHVFRIGTTP